MMLHSHSGILDSNKNKQTATTLDVMYMFPKHIKRKKPGINYVISDRKQQSQQDFNCSQATKTGLLNKWNKIIVGRFCEKS